MPKQPSKIAYELPAVKGLDIIFEHCRTLAGQDCLRPLIGSAGLEMNLLTFSKIFPIPENEKADPLRGVGPFYFGWRGEDLHCSDSCKKNSAEVAGSILAICRCEHILPVHPHAFASNGTFLTCERFADFRASQKIIIILHGKPTLRRSANRLGQAQCHFGTYRALRASDA